MTPDPLSQPPGQDADVPAWLAALGVPGVVDVHTHFMPARLMDRVWAYFDRSHEHYGVPWRIHYRLPVFEEVLRRARLLGLAEPPG